MSHLHSLSNPSEIICELGFWAILLKFGLIIDMSFGEKRPH